MVGGRETVDKQTLGKYSTCCWKSGVCQGKTADVPGTDGATDDRTTDQRSHRYVYTVPRRGASVSPGHKIVTNLSYTGPIYRIGVY